MHWPMKNGSCHPLENWFKCIFGTLLLLEIFLMLKRQFFSYHLCDVSNCVSSKAITCAIRHRYLDNKHLKSFNKVLFFNNFLGKQTIKSLGLYRELCLFFFLTDIGHMIFCIFGNEEKLHKKSIMWKNTDAIFSDT